MKQRRVKLALGRETVRLMTRKQLEHAAGGMSHVKQPELTEEISKAAGYYTTCYQP